MTRKMRLLSGCATSADMHSRMRNRCATLSANPSTKELIMCGIVGYTGTRPVKDILIEGLSRLEIGRAHV